MPSEGGAPRQLTYYPTPGPLPDRWGYDNRSMAGPPTAPRSCSARRATAIAASTAGSTPYPRSGRRGRPRCRCPYPAPGIFPRTASASSIRRSGGIFAARSAIRADGPTICIIFDLEHPGAGASDEGSAHGPRPDVDRLRDLFQFRPQRHVQPLSLRRREPARRCRSLITPIGTCAGRARMRRVRSSTSWTARCICTTRARDQDRSIPSQVPTDDTTHRPQAVNAADNIESEAISPVGGRLAIVARGDVFTVPVEHGVTRNLTHSSERARARSRLVHGRQTTRLRVGSQRRGGDLRAGAGRRSAAAEPVTSNSRGRYYAPRWSGDDKRIAVADQTGRLYVDRHRRQTPRRDRQGSARSRARLSMVAGRPIPRLLAQREQRLSRACTSGRRRTECRSGSPRSCSMRNRPRGLRMANSCIS